MTRGIENIVKESFDSISEQVPDGLWDGIQKGVAENEFYDSVKTGFEQGDEEVPASLWAGIVSSIDANSSSVDKQVSASFESINEKAPESVWNNVQDELDIDRVWSRLNSILVASKHRVNFLMVTAAIFILMFLAYPVNQYSLYQLSSGTNSPELSVNKEVGEVKISEINEAIYIANNEASNQQSKQQNTLVLIEELNKPVKNNKVSSPISVVTNTGTEINKSINKGVELSKGKNLIGHLPINLDTRVKDNYDSVLIDLITENNQTGFSLGAFGGYSNTWIVDNETRSGFKSFSLVENQLSFGNGYGIVGAYKWKTGFNVNVELFVNQSSNQDKLTYVDGNYIEKRTQLNYHKVAVTMGMAGNKSRKLQNNIQLGLYASKLKNSAILNDGAMISFNNDFSQIDFGLRLLVLKEYKVSQFTISAGLSSQFGLLNITSKNANTPRSLNATRNIEVGVVAALKYNF